MPLSLAKSFPSEGQVLESIQRHIEINSKGWSNFIFEQKHNKIPYIEFLEYFPSACFNWIENFLSEGVCVCVRVCVLEDQGLLFLSKLCYAEKFRAAVCTVSYLYCCIKYEHTITLTHVHVVSSSILIEDNSRNAQLYTYIVIKDMRER